MRKDRNTFFAENQSYVNGFAPNNNMMPFTQANQNSSFYAGPNPYMNNTNMYQTNQNDYESRISKLERQVNRLETRINKLEGTSNIDDVNINSNMYMI